MNNLITLKILTIAPSRYTYSHTSSSPLSSLPSSTPPDIIPQIEEDTKEEKEIKDKTNNDIKNINTPEQIIATRYYNI